MGGFYEYDRRGQVNIWSLSVQSDPAYTYVFDVGGTRDFVKSVRHLSAAMGSETYSNIFSDMFKTGDASTMASYLDQLDGVEDGPFSTAVRTQFNDQFSFA